MSYEEDATIRATIDRYLEMNACIRANLGTKSIHDVGDVRIADELWYSFLLEIRILDNEFFNQITSREEKDMIAQKVYNKYRWRSQEN
jgi:hypothetical protein